MDFSLVFLTNIAIILMLGVLSTIIASAFKFPKSLTLIILGLIVGNIAQGTTLVEMDRNFTVALSTLALIMVLFDSSSRLKVREENPHPAVVAKFIKYFLVFSVLALTLFTAGLFFPDASVSTMIIVFIFSILVVETDIGSVLHMVKDYAKEKSGKLLAFLETEADLNTAFVIVLPFLLLGLMAVANVDNPNLLQELANASPDFLGSIITGLGVGLLVGIILIKAMREHYDFHLTPLAVLTAGIVCYLIANVLGGNSIVAVATLGFLYGNVTVKGKEQLQEFSNTLGGAVEIFVFVLLGMTIKVPIELGFVLKTFFLFTVLIVVRLLAAFLTLQGYSKEEKLFITLNVPKGVDLAVVALFLSTFIQYAALKTMLPILVAVIIYSLAVSYLADIYHAKLLPMPAAVEHKVTIAAPPKKTKKTRRKPKTKKARKKKR